MRSAWVRLCTAALALVPACGSAHHGLHVDAVVPGTQFATIQAAIDGLPSGSVVQVLPGRYLEALVLDGKAFTLLGSTNPAAPTEIDAPSPNDPAVVTLSNGASLTAEDLTLSGGQAGVVGLPPVQGTPCSLTGRSLNLIASTRGLSGTFDRVDLKDGEVADHLVTGLSFDFVLTLRIEKTRIHGCKGTGVFLDNRLPASAGSRYLYLLTVEDNDWGGIDVLGGVLPVPIFGCVVKRNRLYGIQLDGAHGSSITSCTVDESKADAGGLWGDAVLVFSSVGVVVSKTDMTSNAHAAVEVVGCPGVEAADVTVGTITATFNGFPFVRRDLDGCATPGTNWFTDGSFNICNGGSCAIVSDGGALAPLPGHVP